MKKKRRKSGVPDNFLTQEEIDALLGGGSEDQPSTAGAKQEPGQERAAVEVEGAETRNLELILDFPLNLSVRLGEVIKSYEEVRRFVPGAVVELDRLISDPVDIFINGKLIARGEVVVVEEYFGIRITNIFTPLERIKKLR